MTKSLVTLQESCLFIATLMLLMSCNNKEYVNLDPDDPRPIFSVQVVDADESALLVQRIGLDIVRIDGHTIYFYEDSSQLHNMEEFGYEIKKENAFNIFRRVVRIDRSVPEAELIANGVRVINREKQFLIIDATIGQLRTLVRSGSQIESISVHEPPLRQIRIAVVTEEDIANIGAIGIDIYSAKSERKDQDQIDTKVEIVIYGGAFDYQIDLLNAAGYIVEILREPAPKIEGEKQ